MWSALAARLICLCSLGSFPLLLRSVTLTSSTHDWVKNNLKIYFNFNDTGSYGLPCNDKVRSCPVGNTLGALVRLVFHDAAGTGGSNGCIDFNTSDNNGLQEIVGQLDTFYYSKEGYFDDYTSMISKADLWIIAGNLAIEYASNASGSAGSTLEILPPTPGGLVLPFQYGRYDAASCDDTHMLPEASYNWTQMKHLFVDRFGMDVGETVAIMGAHSLGRCKWENSGFDGGWLTTASSFSNQYYIEMGGVKWNNSNNSAVWVDDLPEGGAVEKPWTIMLQVDAELLYKTKEHAPNNYCDEFSDFTSNRFIKCPQQTESFPHFMAYANNITHFFGNFSTAWQKMTEYNMNGLVPLGKPCNGTYPVSTLAPSPAPSGAPFSKTRAPTAGAGSTGSPSSGGTKTPTVRPTAMPTAKPSAAPTLKTYAPSAPPTQRPSAPSAAPSVALPTPTVLPSRSSRPTRAPTAKPCAPTAKPSAFPSLSPAQPSLSPALHTATLLTTTLKQTLLNVSSDLYASAAFRTAFSDTIMTVLSHSGIAADNILVSSGQGLRLLADSVESNVTVSYIVSLTLERSSTYSSASALQGAVATTITTASSSISSSADGSSLVATLKRFGAQQGVAQLQGLSAASAPIVLATAEVTGAAPSAAPTEAAAATSTTNQLTNGTTAGIYAGAVIAFMAIMSIGIYTIFHRQIKRCLGWGDKAAAGGKGVVDVDAVSRVSEAGYMFDRRTSYFGEVNVYREQLLAQSKKKRLERTRDFVKQASTMVTSKVSSLVKQASTFIFSDSDDNHHSTKDGAKPAARRRSIFDRTPEHAMQMTTNPMLSRDNSLRTARILESTNNPSNSARRRQSLSTDALSAAALAALQTDGESDAAPAKVLPLLASMNVQRSPGNGAQSRNDLPSEASATEDGEITTL